MGKLKSCIYCSGVVSNSTILICNSCYELELFQRIDKHRDLLQYILDNVKLNLKLLEDNSTSRKNYKNNPNEYNFKVFIILTMSFFEGFFSIQKGVIGEYDEIYTNVITLEEKEKLKTHTTYIDKNGKIEHKFSYNKFLNELMLIFNLYERVFDDLFQINKSDHGWRDFQNTRNLRNNIIHPKTIEDISVNPEDSESIINGLVFVREKISQITKINVETIVPKLKKDCDRLILELDRFREMKIK